MKSFLNELDNYILIVNKLGKIEFCNTILLDALGYKLNEIKNKDINLILSNKMDINDIEVKLKNNSTYKLITKENNLINFDGKYVWKKFNNEDSLFIILKSVESKDDILKKALDAFPFATWIKDLNGKYEYVNEVFANSIGIKEEEIIGKFDFDFLKEGNFRDSNESDKKVKESKKIQLNKECIIVDGEKKWIETYKMPILNSNNIIEYIAGFAKDITLSKNLEFEIKNSYNKTSEMPNIITDNDETTQLLRDIKEEILSSFKADGTSIWIYDHTNEVLSPYLKFGITNELLMGIEEISVDIDTFYNEVNNKLVEGIKPISESNYLINSKIARKNSIKYMGIYKVELNNNVFGLLCIVYKDLDEFKEIQEEFIKNICSQIAILINNHNLSIKLKREFESRADLENELKCFLETAADLMAIIDPRSNFIKVNGSWNKLLGWEEEELLKMSYKDVIYEEDLEDSTIRAKSLKFKKKYNDRNFIHRLKCKDGQIRWISWNGQYVHEKDEYIVTGKDITEQKIAENRNEIFEKALQLETIKNEFFANISHEFKTPLNIILATIQLINVYISSEKIKVLDDVDLNKYIKSIKQNSYRLLRLANNLIDMSKIDSGYYKIHLENYNIVSIIEDITISVASYIENKGIELIFDTDIEEKIIACDPDKIERIMLNLLSNATKYTNKGGNICVNLTTDEEFIITSIKDTGIGIPKEKVEAIFNRFIQVDSTLTRKCEGSGIGLSLAKSLIEMHGGEIEVYSEEGVGTEFIFKLPIKTIDNSIEEKIIKTNNINKVEKCNIEFSDIYDVQ